MKNRSYFFSSMMGSLGRLFRTGNKPDEKAFKDLFSSILFFKESGDTAKENTPGHAKKETDQRAKNREGIHVDGQTRVVSAHQLTELSVRDNTDGTVIHASKTDGDQVDGTGIRIESITRSIGSLFRRNYVVTLLFKNSLAIDGNKLQLKNDSDDPGASKYYGTNASNEKGYHDFITRLILKTSLSDLDLDVNNAGDTLSVTPAGFSIGAKEDIAMIFYNGVYMHHSDDYSFDLASGVIYLTPGWKIDLLNPNRVDVFFYKIID